MQTEIKGKIVLLVLVCHIVAVSLLFFSVEPKPLIKKPHKIAIQNIKLSPKQENTIKSQPLPIIEVIEVIKEPLKEEIKPQDIEEKPLVEEKNTAPVEEKKQESAKKQEPPKKAEKKEAIKKNEIKKAETKPLKEEKKKDSNETKNKKESVEKSKKVEGKKNVVKKEEPKVDPNLLKSIEASIANVGKKTDKPSQKKEMNVNLPQAISKLNIDSDSTIDIQELAYEDELQLYLKSLLILPEFGDVKVKLTLKRSGKVASVKIIKAESKKNKEYLEDALLKLKLPSFGKNFPGQEEKSFTLTLCNAV